MDQRCVSSSRVLVLQVENPEFKPSPTKKKIAKDLSDKGLLCTIQKGHLKFTQHLLPRYKLNKGCDLYKEKNKPRDARRLQKMKRSPMLMDWENEHSTGILAGTSSVEHHQPSN
jgi:hypothetical protein